MAIFRQKEFVAALAGLASSGIGQMAGGFLKDAAIQGAVGVGTTAMSNASQEKIAKQQAQQQEEQNEKQNKLEKAKIAAINSAAASGNLQAATNAAQTAQAQVTFSSIMSDIPGERLFGYSMADVKGFGKDLGRFAKGKTGWALGGLGMGIVTAGTSYLVDKGIQKDKSVFQSNDKQLQQKQYAKIDPTTGKFTKESPTVNQGFGELRNYVKNDKKGLPLKHIWNHHKGGLGMGAVFGAMPLVGYGALKMQQKNVADNVPQQDFQEQRTYSKYSFMKSLKKGLWGSKNTPMRSYDFKKGNAINPLKWHWVQRIVDNPVRGVANVANNLSMGGGETGLKHFQAQMSKRGGSGSKLTKDVVNFTKNHGATSLLAGAGVGSLGMAATWEAGQKLTEKGLRKVDKNAYAYQDSQEQPVMVDY